MNQQLKILVIEDNEGDLTLTEDFLFEQFESPAITTAQNFTTARETLRNKNEFDVILLDLSLPDKKGEQLIQEILEICLNVPVVVLTGYADFSFGVKSLSLGISDYILKEELTALSLHKSILYSLERKRINSALKESEKRHSDLFHLSPTPMWVIDLATLQYLDANTAAIKNYGYSLAEFLSMTIRDLRPAEDLKILENAIVNRYEEEEIMHQGIYKHKKKNGDIILVDILSNNIQFKGKPARIALANDITERMNYIREIEAQNKTLREIAWIQSHVVRAPLARMMGLMNCLSNFSALNDEDRTFLGYLMSSVNEFEKIIKEISDKAEFTQGLGQVSG